MLPWRSSSHSSYNLALVSLQVLLLWMSSWLTLEAASDVVFIVNNKIIHMSEVTEEQGVEIMIGCGYRETVPKLAVSLYRTDVTPDVELQVVSSDEVGFFRVLSHTVSAADATGNRGYRCEWDDTGITASVTIHFDGSSTPDTPATDTPATDTPSTDTPATDTPSTDTPATDTSSPATDSTGGRTSGGNTDTPKTPFKGLKPLIYTVASVVLLGTLAIVAIITCWIRARRSFHNRVLRPNNTPQDYLDYINDNEFTPLTTSEFQASLQERPPTYNQSEEMIQQTGEDGDSTSTAGAASSSTAATGTDSANQSSETQNTSTGRGEGTLADRRRERRRGRQRRVVIVEAGSSGGGGSGQNEQSGDGTAPADQDSSQREGESAAQEEALEQTGNTDNLQTSRGQESNEREPQQQTTSSASSSRRGGGGGEDVGTAERGRVEVLVDLELPSEPPAMPHIAHTSEPPAMPRSAHTSEPPAMPRSAHTPTQQEIEEIEARVSMLEVLSSPPFNSQSQHIFSSAEILSPSVNTGGGGGLSNDNLIDFLDPSNSTVPLSSDF